MPEAIYYKSCISEKGLRQVNEDCFLLSAHKSGHGTAFLISVMDGVGGVDRGEIAAAYVKQSLQSWFDITKDSLFSKTIPEIQQELAQEINAIHKNLLHSSKIKNKSYGTTLTCIVSVNQKYIIAQVGDSRAYIAYRGQIHQMTKDQTQYVQAMERGEEIPAGKEKKYRSTLLTCIGNDIGCKPVFYDGILPYEYELLLCTDGFYKRQERSDFEHFFTSKEDPEIKLKEMVQAVMDRGEKDNITAVYFRKEVN